MKEHDWVNRAHQFLDAGSGQWKTASGDTELRMVTIDMHSALEDTLRWYLNSEHGLTEVLEKSKNSFPSVVQLLRQCTGNTVLDPETTEQALNFNSLRNRVVHEGYVPSRNEVKEGAGCVTTVLRRLLRRSNKGFPNRPYGYKSEQLALKTVALVFLGLATLYAILPDVLPLNPIDDIIVGGPCLLIAIILMVIALRQREGP